MKHLSIALAALAGLFITGCSTTVNTVERAERVGIPNAIEDRRVVTDESLGGKVSIIQVNEGVVSGNIPKIQVLLRNNKDRRLNVNYVFEWYDMDGMRVTSATESWQTLRLMGQEEQAVSAVAPSPRAVDFVLKLQEPKRRRAIF